MVLVCSSNCNDEILIAYKRDAINIWLRIGVVAETSQCVLCSEEEMIVDHIFLCPATLHMVTGKSRVNMASVYWAVGIKW